MLPNEPVKVREAGMGRGIPVIEGDRALEVLLQPHASRPP